MVTVALLTGPSVSEAGTVSDGSKKAQKPGNSITLDNGLKQKKGITLDNGIKKNKSKKKSVKGN